MAIDTRNKRASALGHLRPWAPTLPIPDGDIDAADRQHVTFVYRGIAAAAPVVVLRDAPASRTAIVPPDNRVMHVGADDRTMIVPPDDRVLVA